MVPGDGIAMRMVEHRDAIVSDMRTTVNLAEDVAAAVHRLQRDEGLGLSEALNRLARAGLAPKRARPTFRQRSKEIGLRVDVTNVSEALEELDGPAAR